MTLKKYIKGTYVATLGLCMIFLILTLVTVILILLIAPCYVAKSVGSPYIMFIFFLVYILFWPFWLWAGRKVFVFYEFLEKRMIEIGEGEFKKE